MKPRAAAVALVTLLAACAAPAPPGAAPPRVAAPAAEAAREFSEADRRFALEAAGAGLYQLEGARLAEQRAQNPLVRSYASLLAAQYAVANEELRVLTRSRNLPWPGGTPATRQALLGQLAAQSPEFFDRRYIEQLGVADHQADLVLFEAASRGADDAALRAWAARRVPALHNHLAAAQQIPLRVQAGL